MNKTGSEYWRFFHDLLLFSGRIADVIGRECVLVVFGGEDVARRVIVVRLVCGVLLAKLAEDVLIAMKSSLQFHDLNC